MNEREVFKKVIDIHMKYIGKKVRNKAYKDIFEVKGYMFNNGEYYLLVGEIKVHIDRVAECYEVVE